MKKEQGYKIAELAYYRIEEGFYEVQAITDEDKICIEGNVCAGVLKEIIAKAKQHNAKIKRYNSTIIRNELFKENKYLKSRQKYVDKKISQIQTIVNSLNYFSKT